MASDPSRIYVTNREENNFAIEIPLDEANLSNKLQDITECLRLEFAPIEIWHRISVELYRYGLDKECNNLLNNALEDDLKHSEDWNRTVSTYNGSPENRINLLNAATIQAINAINSNQPNDDDYKQNIRKAMKYYKLARDIAAKFDETEKYNMVFHFLAGLISIAKAKHKKEDISQIMIKTKHDLKKAISVKEMDFDFEDNINHHDLEREPNFIAILCTATLSYSIGDYEDALANYHKLLTMCLTNYNDHYLGFVQLGIAMSALKLKEFDIARHAFQRAKEIDKTKNNGEIGYIGIKSSIGLALVYLNQYSFPEKESDELIKDKKQNNKNNHNHKEMDKKLKSMRKALEQITDAMEYAPNNPQLLVLMANFVGFSFETTHYAKMWAGTAYDICQKITNLIERDPEEYEVLSGLDTKFLLRRNFNIHSSATHNNHISGTGANDNTLSTCLHPLAQCQAEACYVIGKMYHVHNDYDQAIKWYYKSVVLAPYFTLSLFGLAQMYINRNKLDHAKVCLERILKIDESNHQENDSQVLSHYAFVCRELGEIDLAKEKLEKACKLNPNMVDLWIDLAEITEQTDPKYAVQKYMRAKSILQENDESVPFELFNNIIVLLYKIKDFEKAKKLCQELISITKEEDENNPNHNAEDDTKSNKIPHHQIVIQYNYARVLDELCEYKKARKIYRQILITCPSFIEATLCNALYLHRTGKHSDAIRKFEEAAKKAQEYNEISIQLDAELYIQRIWTQIGKRPMAEKTLKKIDEFRKDPKNLKYGIQNDEYSELVSANYMLSLNRSRHHQNYYQRIHGALRKFQQNLVTNPNNAYTAHGIGVVAAEAAELSLAKTILSKLRDCFTSSSLPCNADMMVNLGHVFSAYQQWDNALKCYEKARKKLQPHQQGDIPLYIVRTLFAKKDFVAAKLQLHQILRYNPTQELYLYNLALVEEEYACDILRKDPQKRTLSEVENVMKMLENAKRLYKRLDCNKKTYTGIPQDKLKQHLDHIRNELLENARKHLEFQRNQEKQKEKKRVQEQRKLDKALEKQRKREQEEAMEQKRQRDALRQKAAEAKARGNQIGFDFISSNGRTASGRRRRKRQQREDIPEMEPAPKRQRRDDVRDHMDQFQRSHHEEEGGEYDENHNHRNRFNDEEDEVDIDGDIDALNEEQTERKRLKKKKKKKKKKNKDNNDSNGEKGEIDEAIWAQMEIKIDEIVRAADLNVLTNKQVKKQLAAYFPEINIKAYKSRIKQKINEVAQTLSAVNEAE